MASFNNDDGYGWVARVLHWGMALAIVAMFGLGVWMRSLGYYDPWYTRAPDLHRSVGILLLALLAVRLLWKLANPTPSDRHLSRMERYTSRMTHTLFYLLLFALMIAGYLISTADGRPISVFGLFDVPAIYVRKGLEETAGRVHEYLAYILMAIVGLHAAAALKHHVIDKDPTLTRMWRGSP